MYPAFLGFGIRLADSVSGSASEAREAERRWLSVAETAAYLGKSEKAVRHGIANGSIPYTRRGRSILVDRRTLDEQLERDRR